MLLQRMRKNKKKIQLIILTGIICLAAILRLYNVPYRYSLGEETIRDAVVGLEGAKEFQFPLTGPFSSLGPFTFGPWYWYQLILASLLLHSYYAPWIYLSLTSIAYVYLMFKTGSLLGGDDLGLVAALLAAVSPALILSSTHLTNPDMTHVFVIASFYLFLKLLKNLHLRYWWSFAFGIILGIGINQHYQMAGLLIFPVLLFSYNPKKYIHLLVFSIGVFLTFLPLLFFEANNHWFTARHMYTFLTYGKNAIYVPNSWTIYIRDFWPKFWADTLGVPIILSAAIMLFAAGIFAIQLYKRKMTKELFFLCFAFGANFIALRYYWGERFFGYLTYLRPFVFLSTSFALFTFISSKFGKGMLCVGCLAVIYFSSLQIRNELQKDPYSISYYASVTSLERLEPASRFSVYSCSKQYQSSYAARVNSIVFILAMDKKLSSAGRKVGIQKTECETNIKTQKTLFVNSPELVDLSYLSSAKITEAGWKEASFQSIFDSATRWWFEEKP